MGQKKNPDAKFAEYMEVLPKDISYFPIFYSENQVLVEESEVHL